MKLNFLRNPLFFVLLLTFLLQPTILYAQSQLPGLNYINQKLDHWGLELRILPHSPLYPLKKLWEEVQLLFKSTNRLEEAKTLLKISGERLAEINTLLIESENIAPKSIQKAQRGYKAKQQELHQTIELLGQWDDQLLDLLRKHYRDQIETEVTIKKVDFNSAVKEKLLTTLEENNRACALAYQNLSSSPPPYVIGQTDQQGLELIPLTEATK